MVRHPRDYRWSSYRAHARVRPDPLLTSHELFDRLGRVAIDRQQEYRALFRAALKGGGVGGRMIAALSLAITSQHHFGKHAAAFNVISGVPKKPPIKPKS